LLLSGGTSHFSRTSAAGQLVPDGGPLATIAHQERPEYLDRLSMLRNQVFVLDHMYMSLFSTLGWILRLGVTMALLASIHPALLLLIVFAIPTLWTSSGVPSSREPRRKKARKQTDCPVIVQSRHDSGSK